MDFEFKTPQSVDPQVGMEITCIILYPIERSATVQMRSVHQSGKPDSILGNTVQPISYSGDAYDEFVGKVAPLLTDKTADHLLAKGDVKDAVKGKKKP